MKTKASFLMSEREMVTEQNQGKKRLTSGCTPTWLDSAGQIEISARAFAKLDFIHLTDSAQI